MAILPVLIFITKLLLCFYHISSATNTITYLNPLHDDGTSTLVSNFGTFELGFFTPGSSKNRYIGIWYKNIPDRTIFWVANRDRPITIDNSSVLSISREGNLELISKDEILWSTNLSPKALSQSYLVELSDTGNLVLREDNSNSSNYEDSILWQSFDYPCDTLLPGMKLGWDSKTGLNRRLTAWKNWDDPSPGNFSWGIKLTSNPELVMWKGLVEYHRSGPWNGVRFSGAPLQGTSTIALQILVNEADEISYMYILKNKAMISIIVLNQTLSIRRRFIWDTKSRVWLLYQSVPRDSCDTYNPCGPYGNCIVNASPICQCLEGFEPKSSLNWDTNSTKDWTQGCVRREPWSCKIKDRVGFQTLPSMKLPDTSNFWFDESMELEDCKAKCMGNCSCTAYANLDVRGDGSGCAIWFGDLLDLRITEGGQDLYVPMDIPSTEAKLRKKKMILVLITTITIIIPIVLVFLLVFFYTYTTRRRFQENTEEIVLAENKEESGQEDLELPIFDLATIVQATNDFSIDNKLGQGGFGPVYKGTLTNGQEIAVKRLSRDSGQGLNQFKNEVILYAKLQHRNLVKVLGCCIQGEEKMLVYEYMPHKSLDSFIFDPTQRKLLDWPKRFSIICAIVRGLLYLHQDSRLRIIHRDIKASNILLDNNMNAKISDFGLARMCSGDEDEGSTHTVVGTHGYMAPEYAIDGLFSTKSDVFSFGVLLLEIISGKKNKGLSYPSYNHNLIGHAWRLWKEGKPEELIDDCLRDSSSIVLEITHCIQIGLLCLQHHFDDRPDMASVMVMLQSENTLPQPKEPGFLIHKASIEGETKQFTSSSTNQITVSLLSPR